MLTTKRIRELFESLNSELEKQGVRGELFLAGGAVMCLVFQARAATKDIDALLVPSDDLRRAATSVAQREGLPNDWLNDAVKDFFSDSGSFDIFEERSNLNIYVPQTEYLFAMKCLALRLGEEFQDLSDVRVLIAALGLKSIEDAQSILSRYYALERYPARTRYILEEILSPTGLYQESAQP